jgi:hypothetical protein
MESRLLVLHWMSHHVLEPPGVTIPLFEDGFGRRVLALDSDSGETVERLTFSATLLESEGFAPALGDLVARLANARHTSYARVRRVDRPTASSLALVSDRVQGWRLADVLRTVAAERMVLDVSVVINLLRQLVPAVALFSRHQRDLAIGNVGIARLIVTPQGRLVICEHLLGSALEALHYSRERYWRELRVALPPAPRLSARADVSGIGVVALSLLLGRPLEENEYPDRLPDLVMEATETAGGVTRPASDAFKTWLNRALQIDVRKAFQSPHEAQVAFEAVLAGGRGYVTASDGLEQLLQRYASIAGLPPDAVPPAPAPVPVPVPSPAGAPVSRASEPPVVAVPTPDVAPESVEAAPALMLDHREESDEERSPVPSWSLGPAEDAGIATEAAPQPEPVLTPASRVKRLAAWGLGALVFAEALVIGWLLTGGASPAAGDGELVVQSRPPGARVSIDGKERGATPLTLTLPSGTHVLEVRVGRSEPRVIPLTIRAGVRNSQYVELQSVPTTGGLEIRSDPPRARVLVDGQARGTTPLVLSDLPPGDHEIVLDAGRGRQVKQFVRIEPGVTSRLVVPLTAR